MREVNRTVVFEEEQRFTQWWLWALVIVSSGAALVAFVAGVVDSSDGVPWAIVPVTVVVGVGLPVLFGFARLRVEVHDDRVVLRYRPFTARTIRLADVMGVEAVTYRPVREYGGWGIKGWSRRKVAYNVSGTRGARLTLADGRTVLIGSQRADELAAAIARGLRQPAR